MLEEYISNDYARFFAILFLIFLILKILALILEKVIVRFTIKTKTNLDDLILQKSSKPITIIAFLVGLRIAILEFPIHEKVLEIVSQMIYSFSIVVISYLAYQIAELILFRTWKKISEKSKSEIDDSLSNLIHGFLKTAWVIATILYILSRWGVQVGPFLAGLGIGGIAIAFALQSSLANIFGGISIILDKTIKVGDLIYLDDGTQGKVKIIGLRSTKVLTFDNELIILPNSKLADSKIQNIGLPEPKSRVVIPFSVAYGSDIEKVKKIVLKEIKTFNNLEKDPAPVVRFLEMGSSSINFKAYFYIDSFENRVEAIDEANTKIYNALNKNKIEIPFPQMDVNLRKK